MTTEKLRLDFVEKPDEDELTTFFDMLRSYNRSKAGTSNHKELCIFLRDDDGKIVGGLNGETYWGWLYVENLVVDESVRTKGYGSKLLQAAEDEARNRGCSFVHLDTYSFQALPFYKKHGYTVFGELDDFPPGGKRHFLRKTL